MGHAKGTIKSDSWTIIPLLLYVSRSRITNGTNVNDADKEPASGWMYAIHLTPFIMFCVAIPTARLKSNKLNTPLTEAEIKEAFNSISATQMEEIEKSIVETSINLEVIDILTQPTASSSQEKELTANGVPSANLTLTKMEAIAVMKEGKKVRHRLFSKGEWITIREHANKYYIHTEDGNKAEDKEFWKWNSDTHEYETGWSVVED